VPGHDRTPLARAAGRNVGSVTSNRADMRDFLVTRRAKITPQQAGLTIYGGNRRVPGLRREEVARTPAHDGLRLLASWAATRQREDNAARPA
jgi:hypothetical protein